MSACAKPVSWEQLVDYWAGDLDPATVESVDEHLFGCELCSRESERVARLAQAFRTQVPIVVTDEQVAALRSRGVVIEVNAFVPNVRSAVVFPSGVDLVILRLGGMDLTDVERVHLMVKSESSGEILAEEPFVSFDREKGEVLVACQRHFAAFPPDVVVDVRGYRAKKVATEATYFLPHTFV